MSGSRRFAAYLTGWLLLLAACGPQPASAPYVATDAAPSPTSGASSAASVAPSTAATPSDATL